MAKKAIIFGADSFAEIVHFYLTNDSEYTVVAFTCTADRITKKELFGLPVVPYEEIEKTHPPGEYAMYVAVGYVNLNKTREKFYYDAKAKGYALITYISSKATVWTNEIGDNCFILEDNTLQPFLKIGNNCVFWSGNHIGHHSVIEDNCYITSHVVISGHCRIGANSFIGVNATLRDALTIGRENIIGAGAVILKDTKDNEVYMGARAELFPKDSTRIKKI